MGRIALTGLFAILLILGGCGKSDQNDTPRFNETLGDDGSGAPTSPPTIDAGVMRNPGDYQPANYEPLEPPVSAPASAGAGPEAQAVQESMTQALDALFEMDFEMVLAAFVPEQVEALAQDDYIDNMIAMSDAMRAGNDALTNKTSDPQLLALAGMLEIVGQLKEPLKNTIVASVLDEQNAVATLDLSRLELPEETLTAVGQMMQMMTSLSGGMPGAAPTAGGQAAGGVPPEMMTPEGITTMLAAVKIPIPMRKVDEGWKITLPVALQEQHAELINELVTTVKNMNESTAEAISQTETLDLQTYMQISQQVQMRYMPELLGLIGRVNVMAAELMGAPATDDAEPAETP